MLNHATELFLKTVLVHTIDAGSLNLRRDIRSCCECFNGKTDKSSLFLKSLPDKPDQDLIKFVDRRYKELVAQDDCKFANKIFRKEIIDFILENDPNITREELAREIKSCVLQMKLRINLDKDEFGEYHIRIK